MKGTCRSRRSWQAVLFAVAVIPAASPSAPAEQTSTVESPDTGSAVPGARLDELLATARRINPDIAAAALDTEAALARVAAAGRFPDPMFKTELWDVRAARDTALPQAPGQVKYTVEQTIPLWGKRDLQRKIASAEAGSASEQRRAVETDLLARIKTVFAGSWGTQETIRITRELLGSVSAVAGVAQSRYGQGRGNQQDVVTAEVERGRLQADLARLDGQRLAWMAQMNALLNRPAGAPLAPPQGLRPVPDADAMPLAELLERGRRDNPQLASEQAMITAAERNAELARRNWYPDPTFGFTVFDEDGSNGRQFGGYEAMISFAIPLQWGLRRAQEQEALARAAASRTRREATRRRPARPASRKPTGRSTRRAAARASCAISTFPQANVAAAVGARELSARPRGLAERVARRAGGAAGDARSHRSPRRAADAIGGAREGGRRGSVKRVVGLAIAVVLAAAAGIAGGYWLAQRNPAGELVQRPGRHRTATPSTRQPPPTPPQARRPRSARFSTTAIRWGCRTPRPCRRRTRWGWTTSRSTPTRRRRRVPEWSRSAPSGSR